jgi:hypothetical protein
LVTSAAFAARSSKPVRLAKKRTLTMPAPTAYQYSKLGSSLEYLRGVCSASLMQTTSLVAFPSLMENLPFHRYTVIHVIEAMQSLLVLLDEMKLERALQAAEPLRPMLREMADYLSKTPSPETAFLQDEFANQIVELAKQVGVAVRQELSGRTA